MPVLTIFAGPNGSGKSSIIDRVAFVGRDNLLEADAIAKRIRATQSQSAPIALAAKYSAERKSISIPGGLCDRDYALGKLDAYRASRSSGSALLRAASLHMLGKP